MSAPGPYETCPFHPQSSVLSLYYNQFPIYMQKFFYHFFHVVLILCLGTVQVVICACALLQPFYIKWRMDIGYQTAYASRVHRFMLNHGQNIFSVSLKFSKCLTFRICF